MHHVETTLEAYLREQFAASRPPVRVRKTTIRVPTVIPEYAIKYPESREPGQCLPLVLVFIMIIAFLGGFKSAIASFLQFCFHLVCDSIQEISCCFDELVSEPSEFASHLGMYIIYLLCHLYSFQPPYSTLIFKCIWYTIARILSNFPSGAHLFYDSLRRSGSRFLPQTNCSYEPEVSSKQSNLQITYEPEDEQLEKLNSTITANANTIMSQERQINAYLQTISGLDKKVNSLISENYSYEQTLTRCLPTGLGCGLITHETFGKTKAELLCYISELKIKAEDEERRHDRAERLLARAKKDHKKELEEVRSRMTTTSTPSSTTSNAIKRITPGLKAHKEEIMTLKKQNSDLQTEKQRRGVDLQLKAQVIQVKDQKITDLEKQVKCVAAKDDKIAVLEEKVKDIQAKNVEIAQQRKKIEDLEQKTWDIQLKDNKIAEQNKDINTLQLKVEETKAKDDKIVELGDKIKVLEQKVNGIKTRDDKLGAQNTKIVELQTKISNLENQTQELNEKENTIAILRNQVGGMQTKDEEITRLKANIAELQQTTVPSLQQSFAMDIDAEKLMAHGSQKHVGGDWAAGAAGSLTTIHERDGDDENAIEIDPPETEVDILSDEVGRLESENSILREEKEKLHSEHTKAGMQYNDLYMRWAGLQSNATYWQTTASLAENAINEKNLQIASMENTKDSEIKNLQDKVLNLQHQLEAYSGKLTSFEMVNALQSIPALRKDNERLIKELDEANQKNERQKDGEKNRRKLLKDRITELEARAGTGGESFVTPSKLVLSVMSSPAVQQPVTPSNGNQNTVINHYNHAANVINKLHGLIKQRKPLLLQKNGQDPEDFPPLDPKDQQDVFFVTKKIKQMDRAYYHVAKMMVDQSWSMTRYNPAGRVGLEPKASEELLAVMKQAMGVAQFCSKNYRTNDWTNAFTVLSKRT